MVSYRCKTNTVSNTAFRGFGGPQGMMVIEAIMARRNAGQTGREGEYAVGSTADPIPAPVLLWQRSVHVPGIYDLEVDTSLLTPSECAAAIGRRLADGPPSAFARLAAGAGAAS